MTRPQVHILATVRKPELLYAALLVFKTLRVGFPSAVVTVWGNHLRPEYDKEVRSEAARTGCLYQRLAEYVPHDRWIETLVERNNTPFWICDTDIVFFSDVEVFNVKGNFSGQLEPSFHEEWTKTLHISRLHTALMVFDPLKVRLAIRQWMCKVPPIWMCSADFPLIRQTFVPALDFTVFYDSCAALYHAIGGTPFDDVILDRYEHLHCGTYSDLVEPHLSVKGMGDIHKAIYQQPALAKGIRAEQDKYYKLRK